MRIEVTSEALAAMRAHAAAALPHEACGILLGAAFAGGGRITEARAAANVHPSPHTHFDIAPQALIAAHRAARGGGLAVIGYYHSHPRGPAAPSATDRASANRDAAVWAIIAGTDVTFWQDGEQGFTALPLCLIGG
jgi:proteasome lid subunit RPN8/RPN11